MSRKWIDGRLGDEGRVPAADLDQDLALVEQALAHGQQAAAQAAAAPRVEGGRPLRSVVSSASSRSSCSASMARSLSSTMWSRMTCSRKSGPLPTAACSMRIASSRRARAPSASGMSADRDEESLSDEEVHFLDAERPVVELMPIEEDEGVAGEVLDLRHLLVVQAVLDGQRVEPEWDRQRVQVIARGVDEVDPDVSARRPGGQRGGGRGETGHPAVLGDVIATQV